MIKYLNIPASPEQIQELCAGDYVYLTGTMFTARDAAHKRKNENNTSHTNSDTEF